MKELLASESLLIRLIIPQLVKYPTFYATVSFITCLPQPATCSCPERDQSSPEHTSYVLKIRFNIIFPSKPWSSKLFISLWFLH